MKRKKTITIMLICLCVLTLGLICLKAYNKNQDKIKNSGEVVVSFETSDVNKIEWKISGSTLAFSKTEDVWVYDFDSTFPVDEEYLMDMILLPYDFEAAFVIDEPASLSDYGLASSKNYVKITTEDEEITITFGSYSSMDSQRYFSLGDGKVYLASEDIMDEFDCSISNFAKDDEIPSMDTVSMFTVSGDNTLIIEYKEDANYTYSNNFVYYIKSGSNYKAIDESKAESLLNEIKNLSLTDNASYDADLSEYGLEDPDLTIKISYSEDASGSETKEFILNLASPSSEKYYAQVEDSKFVYVISESVYTDILDAGYESLRPDEIENVDWTTVSEIEFSVDGQSYEMGVENNGKGTYTYTFNNESCEGDYICSGLDAITISEFKEELSHKKKELGVTVYFAEGSAAGSYQSITLEFYRLDGEYCAAYFDNELLGTVERADVVDLIENIYDIVL